MFSWPFKIHDTDINKQWLLLCLIVNKLEQYQLQVLCIVFSILGAGNRCAFDVEIFRLTRRLLSVSDDSFKDWVTDFETARSLMVTSQYANFLCHDFFRSRDKLHEKSAVSPLMCFLKSSFWYGRRSRKTLTSALIFSVLFNCLQYVLCVCSRLSSHT